MTEERRKPMGPEIRRAHHRRRAQRAGLRLPTSPAPASRSACSSGRHIVGGAAVTEEFHPGFRNSTASYTVSLLRPKVIRDMRLHERGWRIIERTISNFFPHEGGYLKLGGAPRAPRPSSRASARRTPRPSPDTRKRSSASPKCCATWRSRPRPTLAAASARCSPPPRRASGWRACRSKPSAT